MGTQRLEYEAGQNVHDWEEMTDSGDATKFEASFSPFSKRNGDVSVAPYGVLTGLVVSVNAGTDDSVGVTAGTVQAPGMTGADADGVVSVSADSDVAITRGLSTDTHNITSITVDSSGTIVAVSGTDSTAFSETRGAAGGPPFIPVGSIEIAQVRTTSITAGDVLASEIKQVPNTHRETADLPVHTVDYAEGEVTFSSALNLIHTGGVPKKVYVKGDSPEFAALQHVSEFTPADESHSSNSTDTYDGAVGSTTASLGQGSFSFLSDDGISDGLIQLKGSELWFRYYPNKNSTYPHQLTLGTLGVSRANPAGSGKKTVSCTITAVEATKDVLSA